MTTEMGRHYETSINKLLVDASERRVGGAGAGLAEDQQLGSGTARPVAVTPDRPRPRQVSKTYPLREPADNVQGQAPGAQLNTASRCLW